MRKQILNDTDLVNSYINGNERSLEILITRHKSRVYYHIFQLVKNDALADDLFQDTFIKVINTIKSGKYSEEGKFLPWVMRIAHNLTIDHIRKAGKVKFIEAKNPDTDVFDFVKDDTCNVEYSMITDQIAEDIRELINRLPQDQNEIITMRHYADMSFKEIAEELDISINTALGRMRYALINLRKLIEAKNISLHVQ